MTTTATAQTREILAAMLTENTGRHMLDSGGAYGRHWERNAGRTVADYEAQPPAWADRWGITLSVFHYLAERVEYAQDMDSEFETFAAANPDEGWLTLAEMFAESRDRTFHTWNTYNGEDMLSQTLQGVTFAHEGDVYALIQIHGGCDVRGGYTQPRAFRIACDMPESFPYDNADALLHCPNDSEHSVSINYRECLSLVHGYSLEDREQPRFGDSDSDAPLCGVCGAALEVEAPAAY